jgi:hypothetical protein
MTSLRHCRLFFLLYGQQPNELAVKKLAMFGCAALVFAHAAKNKIPANSYAGDLACWSLTIAYRATGHSILIYSQLQHIPQVPGPQKLVMIIHNSLFARHRAAAARQRRQAEGGRRQVRCAAAQPPADGQPVRLCWRHPDAARHRPRLGAARPGQPPMPVAALSVQLCRRLKAAIVPASHFSLHAWCYAKQQPNFCRCAGADGFLSCSTICGCPLRCGGTGTTITGCCSSLRCRSRLPSASRQRRCPVCWR